MPASPLSRSASREVSSGGHVGEAVASSAKSDMADCPNSTSSAFRAVRGVFVESLSSDCSLEAQQQTPCDVESILLACEEGRVKDADESVEKEGPPRSSAETAQNAKSPQPQLTRCLQQRSLNCFYPHLPSPPICKEKTRKRQQPTTQRLDKAVTSKQRMSRDRVCDESLNSAPKLTVPFPENLSSESNVSRECPYIATSSSNLSPSSAALDAEVVTETSALPSDPSLKENLRAEIDICTESGDGEDTADCASVQLLSTDAQEQRALIEIECSGSGSSGSDVSSCDSPSKASAEVTKSTAPCKEAEEGSLVAAPLQKPQTAGSASGASRGLSAAWSQIFKSQQSLSRSEKDAASQRKSQRLKTVSSGSQRLQRRRSAGSSMGCCFSKTRSQVSAETLRPPPHARLIRKKSAIAAKGEATEPGAEERRGMCEERQLERHRLYFEEQRQRLMTHRRLLRLGRFSRLWLEAMERRTQRQSAGLGEGNLLTERQKKSLPEFFRKIVAAKRGFTEGPLTVFVQGPFLFFSDEEVKAMLEAAGISTTFCKRRATCRLQNTEGCWGVDAALEDKGSDAPSSSLAEQSLWLEREALATEPEFLRALGSSAAEASKRFEPRAIVAEETESDLTLRTLIDRSTQQRQEADVKSLNSRRRRRALPDSEEETDAEKTLRKVLTVEAPSQQKPVAAAAHLVEDWSTAFCPASPAEVAGHDNAALSLFRLLRAARRTCEKAAEKASQGPVVEIDLSSERPSKRLRQSRSEDSLTRESSTSVAPGLLVVVGPPACAVRRLIHLVGLACGFWSVDELHLRESKSIHGLMRALEAASLTAQGLVEEAKDKEKKKEETGGDACFSSAWSGRLLHLSVYDFWSLSKKELQKLLQRRRGLRPGRSSTSGLSSGRLATAAAAASAAAPDICLAIWRPGETADSALRSVEVLLEEAAKETRGERGDETEEGGNCSNVAWRVVQCFLPEREALTQRLLAIARGALGLRLDRRFVELLLEACVQGPWSRPSLSLALNSLHILLRPHPLLRRQHALAMADNAESCANSETAPSESFAFEAVDGEEAPHDRTARSEMQELMLQRFVLPPLERALELPWGLAEAPLMPAWRLQQLQGQNIAAASRSQRQLLQEQQSLQLLHFASRNAETSDCVAAPLHALDLLVVKFNLCWNCPWRTAVAVDSPRVKQICNVLQAFKAAASMLAWDAQVNGALESEDGCGAVSSKQSGMLPSQIGIVSSSPSLHGGGDPSFSISAGESEALVAAARRLALPAAIGKASALVASWIGEVTLGSVALLQHGRLEDAFSHPEFGTPAAVLQRRSLQNLIFQHRNQTRRRLAKLADGPQRAAALSQRLSAFFNATAGTSLFSSTSDVISKVESVSKEIDGEGNIKSATWGNPTVPDDDDHSPEYSFNNLAATLFSDGHPLNCCGFLSVASTLSLSEELRLALVARASAALGGGQTKRRGTAGKGPPRNAGKNRGIISTLEAEAKLTRVLDVLEDVDL